MDALISSWDSDAFTTHLPDLRLAFTRLRPQDTAELAGRVAQLHSLSDSASLAEVHYETSEADLAHGLQLQRMLTDCLKMDGLVAWIA